MKLARPLFCLLVLACCVRSVAAEEFALHSFERQQLTDVYFSEGANAGDINGDGIVDLVYGPHWYAGPDFKTKQEIYPPVPQNLDGYADNFFTWIYDFNRDGWNDILIVGLPGTPAFIFEHPKPEGLAQHWKKHKVFDGVNNESPQFVNITGDDQPELICTHDGFYGYASFDPEKPFSPWSYHPISEKTDAGRFAHGLGIGDVNGDGRLDMIHPKGWYEQPATNADNSRWTPHEASFTTAYGGAEMYAYDVDGDGDNDIITSDAAHDFGLSWYEQIKEGAEISFKHHVIMGKSPAENRYGVLFTELHSVSLVDMDGDGLKDIVTGKTYWSHHRGSPMWDAGAVVYWFKFVRTLEGVDWVPFQADGEAGIGRQVTIADVNKDGLPDMVLGGMKGGHVLIHKKKTVTKEEWQAAQPKVYEPPHPPSTEKAKATRGPKALLDDKTVSVTGALEGESLKFTVTAGQPQTQAMANFKGDRWSWNSQLWWAAGRAGESLTLTLPPFSDTIDLELVLTCARDYGIVQVSLDDQPLGDPIDLYNAEVITTGVLSFPKLTVKGREHKLKIQVAGTNPQAAAAFMVGLDYLRINQADGTFVSP